MCLSFDRIAMVESAGSGFVEHFFKIASGRDIGGRQYQ
jgi:hypothetical protein